MIRKSAIILYIGAIASGLAGCNSNSDDPTVISASSNVMVSSFSLADDEDVLDSLSNVYFSIDLIKAQIFNADSLPYGTNISRLIPVISTNGASVAELQFPRPGKNDSIVNYLTNSKDSIDFSNGPVKLRIVSQDGAVERYYQIKVNVHQVKSDSLVWTRMSSNTLPSLFQVSNEQRTAQSGEMIYCLTRYGSRYCMASSSDPGTDDWEKVEITFPFIPDVKSFRATDNGLFILGEDGNLFRSSDGGLSWIDCGTAWNYIYGGFGTVLFGSKVKDGEWYRVTYPGSDEEKLPQSFPVEGTSLPITFIPSMSASPQMIITGGRLASGDLTGDTWGFDGSTWAKISKTPVPTALEDMAVAPYFTFKTNTSSWKADKYSTLVAIGGNDAKGKANRTVYISLDFGMNWKKADQLMQLPEQIPAMTGAQAFVCSSAETSRQTSASASWHEIGTWHIPSNWEIINSGNYSRATSEAAQWECPYIYLFGGINEQGSTYNTVWRGVINRFTFTPIQ